MNIDHPVVKIRFICTSSPVSSLKRKDKYNIENGPFVTKNLKWKCHMSSTPLSAI